MSTTLSKEQWNEVRDLFEHGMAIRHLARHYEIPEGTALARAHREGWTKHAPIRTFSVKRILTDIRKIMERPPTLPKLPHKKGWTKRNRKWPGATLKEQAKNRYIAMWKLANPGRDWPPPKPPKLSDEEKRLKQNAYQKARNDRIRGCPARPHRLTPEQRKAKRREEKRLWRLKNPERYREKQRRSYEKNKAARLVYAKKWREANPERSNALKRAWDKTPKGVAAQKNGSSTRRANLAKVVVTATKQDIKDILSKAISCRYCNARFTKSNRPTIDHIIPIAKGGPHSVENLTCACRSCNSSKCAKMPEEFARERGWLLFA